MNRNYLSPFILERIPAFIKHNNSDFYNFIAHYFEFLEEEANPLQIIEDFTHNLEINNKNDDYVNKILEEMGFPSDIEISIPKAHLLHFLREFYLTRGNIDSFKFFFKLLYNTEVEVNYPREKLFSSSLATYGGKYYIFTTANSRNTEYFNEIVSQGKTSNITIRGLTSKIMCSIEDIIISIVSNNKKYLKIQVNSDLNNFIPFEGIEIFINGTGIKISETIANVLNLDVVSGGSLYKVGDDLVISGCNIRGIAKVKKIIRGRIQNVTITQAGTGYEVGDIIKASKIAGGHSFSAQVYRVDEDGAITQVEVLCPGFDFEEIPSLRIISENGSEGILTASSNDIGKIEFIEFLEPFADIPQVNFVNVTINSLNGNGAVLTPSIKTIFSEKKQFQTENGFLGTNCTLLDSNYYQQFSYELVSSIPENKYGIPLDIFLHPPGFTRFSGVVITYDEIIINDYNINNVYECVVIKILYNEDSSFTLSYTTDFALLGLIETDCLFLGMNSINNLEFYKNFESYNTPASEWNTATESFISDNNNIMFSTLDAEIDIIIQG